MKVGLEPGKMLQICQRSHCEHDSYESLNQIIIIELSLGRTLYSSVPFYMFLTCFQICCSREVKQIRGYWIARQGNWDALHKIQYSANSRTPRLFSFQAISVWVFFFFLFYLDQLEPGSWHLIPNCYPFW